MTQKIIEFFLIDTEVKTNFCILSAFFFIIFMMNCTFLSFVFWFSFSSISIFPMKALGQKQDFESQFSITSFPGEFLPGWYGNEVRSPSSRIFQTLNLGKGNSRALAVQPINTFNGEIWIRLNPSELERPKVSFWARSLQNGTGNRPAVVYFSWGERLNGGFSDRVLLGGENEFGNENQEYRRFVLEVPIEYEGLNEVFLKLEILYGAGSGSAARWFLDDFEMGDFVQDATPPKVKSIKGYSSKEILLGFDEPIDPVFSLLPLAYKLDGIDPEKINSLNDSTRILRFEENLEEGKSYRLDVMQIPDLEGNFLRDTSVNFRFTDPTSFDYKSLVINELMPAPRADQDLPNVEYVELYNPSAKEFRLQGLLFSNSRSTASLPEFWIQPGAYVLLAPSSQSNQLKEFGNVIPISSWPTLLNSGDRVSLTSSQGVLIDQLSYATFSWGGSEFASGGYSLEVVHPEFLCDNSGFLKSSMDPARGTPGKVNSVFSQEIDLIEFEIESAFFVNSREVEVVFNQLFLPTISTNQITFSDGLKADSTWISLNGNAIKIKLDREAIRGRKYEVKITSLVNCRGVVQEDPLSANLVLAEAAGPGDLIINEVLFDARVGDPKFVEIHNTTDKFLSLESWALGNLNNSGQTSQVRIFGGRGDYLEPGGFLAITTDTNSLKLAYPKSVNGHFFQIPSLPSYPISGGTVVLISNVGEAVEKFTYDPKMHHPLIRNTKGVSLERISSTSAAALDFNWQSASGNEDFATPGKRNSTVLGEFESNLIQIEPQVFDPEGSVGATFTTIRYELDQPGWVGSFSVFSASGLAVHTLAQNQPLGTQGLLTWNGTDDLGARVRPGYYVLLVELVDTNGKILIFKKTLVVAAKL